MKTANLLSILLLPASLILTPVYAANEPDTYSAEAVGGTVIDQRTAKPLAGVIVVAHWQLKGGIEGGHNLGQMAVMETVTDEKGHFKFPAWGPKKRPKNAFLDYQDPQLILFKPGYWWRGVSNEVRSKVNQSPIRHAAWSGKTFDLKPFDGSPTDYWMNVLGSLESALSFAVVDPKDCEWKQIPKILVALEKERLAAKKQDTRVFLRPIAQIPSTHCGSPTDFFAPYFK